ncbi:MAG: CapA family protein [Lachnospiraceae bacterium]
MSENRYTKQPSQSPRGIKDAKRRQSERNGIRHSKKIRARRRRRKKILRMIILIAMFCIFIGLIAGIITAVKGIASLFHKEEKKEPVKQEETVEKKVESTIDIEEITIGTSPKKGSEKPVTVTLSFTGDCTLGTDVNFDQEKSLNAYYDAQGSDYFLKNVRSVFEKDDMTIVNFEGTLTTSDQRAEKTYAFKADPEYSSILSGSFIEGANIANNHSHDYCNQGFTDTLAALKDANISSFGYDQALLAKINGVKVGFAGINEIEKHQGEETQIKNNIDALKDAGAKLIVITMHWGAEKEYTPNQRQKELAHYAIDEGADLVIGHHPHVLQDIETYKGKTIAYSLGNFCFGGNKNPADKDTMILQKTYTFENGKLKDTDETNIIPCSISSANDYNDYCPVILEGAEKERVMQKIEKYSKEIETPEV